MSRRTSDRFATNVTQNINNFTYHPPGGRKISELLQTAAISLLCLHAGFEGGGIRRGEEIGRGIDGRIIERLEELR